MAFPPAQVRAADLGAASAPLTSGIDFAARGPADADAHGRELRCLAQAVYYEAANQPLEGRQAVAQVVLNRLRHPSYPKSVCGVVYQGAARRGCQFTFTCDGSLARTPPARDWRDAMDVAERALGGFVAASVGLSTHYHTLQVHPFWSAALTPTVRIGAHQFYRVSRRARVGWRRSAWRGGAPAEGVGAHALEVDSQPAPRMAAFSIWGLEVARVAPAGGGATVTPSASATLTGAPQT